MKDRVVVGHIIFGEQEYLKLGGEGRGVAKRRPKEFGSSLGRTLIKEL